MLWAKLAGVNPFSKPFYLAGGTALALQLEHRESIDFDFFHPKKFNTEKLVSELAKLGRLDVQIQTEDTFVGVLSDVKISYFNYPYPLLKEPMLFEGISIASLDDIAAMKIIALSQRGQKKDFVDLHALLAAGWNLESIFRCVERKFEGREYNRAHLLKSLVYFEESESSPMPVMLQRISWKKIRRDLEQAAKEFIR